MVASRQDVHSSKKVELMGCRVVLVPVPAGRREDFRDALLDMAATERMRRRAETKPATSNRQEAIPCA
jgi:hypothetical protein